MEWIIIVLILGLAAITGAAAFYMPRELHRLQGPGYVPDRGGMEALRLELEARFEAEIERFRRETERAFASIGSNLEQVLLALNASAEEQNLHVDQLRQRASELDSQSVAAIEAALLEIRGQHSSEFSTLRETLHGLGSEVRPGNGATSAAPLRWQVISDLSGKLAALEAAVAASLDPELLPGERIAVPVHLRPATLQWENWKEVGDAAFNFAELFATNRVTLDDQTELELMESVSRFRSLLTRGIYANLQHVPVDQVALGQAQQAADQLVDELCKARATLTAAYRAGTGRPVPTRSAIAE